MKLIYNVSDRPSLGKLVVFAIQQLLAIMAATLCVPLTVGNGMDPAAALFGAGAGTLIYVLFTRKKSPVFLGSSFGFLGSMIAAFAGGISMSLGYLGLILGTVFAGLVYVVLAIVVKLAGTKWIDYVMPAIVIGPTVSIIGLSCAGYAVGNIQTAPAGGHTLLAVLCGVVALIVTGLCATYGSKKIKLVPFVVGIVSGYIFAAILTVIGKCTGCDALLIVDFTPFTTLFDDGVLSGLFQLPEFTFITAFDGFKELDASYLGVIAVAYIPVAFVVFAEHIADHKNLSTIIEKNLLEEPGLTRTLLGDGIGSMVGGFFGGCANTTYGESIACVAVTGNASVYSIIAAAVLAILVAFVGPFVAFINSIPLCVIGGVSMALYGFIAVSGLKMIQKVDLEDNRNLFVISAILVSGIGGLALDFGRVKLTTVATSLILGIILNVLLSRKKKSE